MVAIHLVECSHVDTEEIVGKESTFYHIIPDRYILAGVMKY